MLFHNFNHQFYFNLHICQLTALKQKKIKNSREIKMLNIDRHKYLKAIIMVLFSTLGL